MKDPLSKTVGSGAGSELPKFETSYVVSNMVSAEEEKTPKLTIEINPNKQIYGVLNNSPLHFSLGNLTDDAKTDLRKVAQLKYQDKFGENVFHIAARRNDIQALEIIRQNKSKSLITPIVNQQNNEGKTPLHYAAMWQRTDIVKLLLEMGADPGITDQDNKKPIDYCENILCRSLLSLEHYSWKTSPKASREEVIKRGALAEEREAAIRADLREYEEKRDQGIMSCFISKIMSKNNKSQEKFIS